MEFHVHPSNIKPNAVSILTARSLPTSAATCCMYFFRVSDSDSSCVFDISREAHAKRKLSTRGAPVAAVCLLFWYHGHFFTLRPWFMLSAETIVRRATSPIPEPSVRAVTPTTQASDESNDHEQASISKVPHEHLVVPARPTREQQAEQSCHCLLFVRHNKKWKRAGGHLMRCDMFLKKMEAMSASERPEWFLLELQKTTPSTSNISSQPMSQQSRTSLLRQWLLNQEQQDAANVKREEQQQDAASTTDLLARLNGVNELARELMETRDAQPRDPRRVLDFIAHLEPVLHELMRYTDQQNSAPLSDMLVACNGMKQTVIQEYERLLAMQQRQIEDARKQAAPAAKRQATPAAKRQAALLGKRHQVTPLGKRATAAQPERLKTGQRIAIQAIYDAEDEDEEDEEDERQDEEEGVSHIKNFARVISYIPARDASCACDARLGNASQRDCSLCFEIRHSTCYKRVVRKDRVDLFCLECSKGL